MLGRVRVPPVPRRLRSYWALRLPALLRALASVPLARAYLHRLRFFFAGGRVRMLTRLRRDGSPAPVVPVVLGEGEAGPPSCLVYPLGHVPWSNTPPDAPHPRPFLRTVRCCLPGCRTLGLRNVDIFGAVFPRPTSSRTYASPPRLPASSQGSLPTCGTALWLDGLRTRRIEFLNFRSRPSNSFLSVQPFLVAPTPMPLRRDCLLQRHVRPRKASRRYPN